jgi:hypothetical protein
MKLRVTIPSPRLPKKDFPILERLEVLKQETDDYAARMRAQLLITSEAETGQARAVAMFDVAVQGWHAVQLMGELLELLIDEREKKPILR